MDTLPFFLMSFIKEGLVVTVIGVTIVFLVLGVLSLAIYLVGVITSRVTTRIEKKREVVLGPKVVEEEDEELAAVIGAALAAYIILKSKQISRPVSKDRSLWDYARKVEAVMPEFSISRLNYDEFIVNERLRRA